MVSITVAEIQEVYGEQEPSLSTTKQEALKDVAEGLTDDVYGGRVSRYSEIEGDDGDFARYMGAHLWKIAEGETLNNEFQTGNSGERTIRSDPEGSLSNTIYGTVCLQMLRDRASTGIVRADW